MFKAVGENGQDIGAELFQPPYQAVDGLKIAAHPVGTVKEDSDVEFAFRKPQPQVVLQAGTLGHVGMVQPFPRQVGWGFVAVAGIEVGVAEEKEKILQILDAASHQVGKNGLNFRHGRGARGHQVFVPFLVPGTCYQGYAAGLASTHQRIKKIR